MRQDEVKSLVSTYLKRVRMSGPDNIMATCPFHLRPDGSEERTPSFSMSLSKGLYYCFSCHTSGNLYTFLRDVGVPQAAIHNQYGLLIDELRRQHAPKTDALQNLRGLGKQEDLSESVLGFFDYCPLPLVDPAFASPEDPLFYEGLLQRLDIGFDPKHNRITFPLRDVHGRLVGISGRAVANELPRYKVYTKEYEDFGLPMRAETKRGSLLWNAHRVMPVVYHEKNTYVILVEGFKACLWLLQIGYTNVVAMLGSHLTPQQKAILENMGCVVFIMMDNDDPGQKGLQGYIDDKGRKHLGCAEILAKSLQVRVVVYEGKQPTRLTKEQVVAAVDSAPNYYQWANDNRKVSVPYGV